MIKDVQAWEKWEKEQRKNDPIDLALNLKILDSMFESARHFHLFPSPDPLEGVDLKIYLARVLNVSKAA